MPYKSTELEINKLLGLTLERGASDLHLSTGKPPILRIDGALEELKDFEILSGPAIASMVDVILQTDLRRKDFREKLEIDFSFPFKDNNRFRVNAYYQKGNPSAALRLVNSTIKTP